ncbi:MAG: adenosylcobalamin-dependent ribonucleoside-diphosphate reductase [Victivallaceae bacterium]|nr:adenosylcobalamin-dependent ribonucleoside-diphosphate reductase [Victivallaceae bacterium]
MTMKEYSISHDIWERKYRYSGSSEVLADQTLSDTMKRVATACAKKETDSKKWGAAFESILATLEFLPGGRIIANAGTSRGQTTMFNCYVMNKIEDSIEGIFDTVKASALTQKQGGGVGFDFSTIRPRNANIKGCEAPASGPLSFMRVLDSTCRTIMSAGQRRGAQMGVMRCDHPDIEEFITAKRGNSQLQMFNLSVAITSEFIQAVKDNANWDLKFNGKVLKTVKAQELWETIMRSTYDFAEPGFLLIDKINQMNNLYYCEEVCATNPCGEQPLPPFGACLLGSINLTKFIENPFEENAKINLKRLREVITIAVRMLDNVIDISNYPLEEQRQEAYSKRRMGLGITGLADALIFMRVKYGSPESVRLSGEIMREVTHAAYRASIEIAAEKGEFKLLDREKYCDGQFIATLPQDIRDGIMKHGIRNSHLTSIAPTGTISLLADNISSGLEPVFSFKYTRKIRNGNEDDVTEVEISDYAYRQYCSRLGVNSIKDQDLPAYFTSAGQIKPVDHLGIQAILQKYVDSSISKTINIPEDYPFEDFKDIYMQAYEQGLKGCTTFRPNENIMGILIKKDDAKKVTPAELQPHNANALPKRPEELTGTTYKIKTAQSPDAFYITINDYVEDGKHRPYELFINTKNLQHFSWIVAMSRLISAVFRNNPDPTFLIDELKSIYDPNGGSFRNGKYVPSLAAEIGYVIQEHMVKIGLLSREEKPAVAVGNVADMNKMICPECRERELINQENCLKCLSCSYSKCS